MMEIESAGQFQGDSDTAMIAIEIRFTLLVYSRENLTDVSRVPS